MQKDWIAPPVLLGIALVLSHCCDWTSANSTKCQSPPPHECQNGNSSNPSIHCAGKVIDAFPEGLCDFTQVLIVQNGSFDIIDHVPYKHLISLTVENCNVRYVKDAAFKGLSNLTSLYLDNNHITSIANETLLGLRNLKFIRLSFNPIYFLQTTVFSHTHTPDIVEINLDNCQIYDIAPRAFSLLSKLTYLNLSYNMLSKMPVFHMRDELSSLHTLALSGNKLHTIADSGLGYLKNLQNLFLRLNQFERITNADTKGLHHSLVLLDLSSNQISYIEPTAFTEMQRLGELNLVGNQITTLYWEEFPWGSLTKLSLMDNPWDCSCNNSWMIEGNSPAISVTNNNPHTRCASPESVKNQPVFEVPIETFACTNPDQHHVKRALTIVFGLLVALVVGAGILIILFKLRARIKKRNNYDQPYTKVTANGGIHM